ncbi:hypothetical protein KEJ19_04850 [Candidatus Bathyarchaeota archaeon]|nr:hypothetical protein [Candidatus Bathyarchaeota archaeon]
MKLSLMNKIYWGRLLLGIAIGLLCALLNIKGLAAVLFSILIYAILYYILKLAFGLDSERLGGPRKLLLEGIGAYFLSWFVTWIMAYTILMA